MVRAIFHKTDVALYKTFDAQKPERPENSSFSILTKTTKQLLFSYKQGFYILFLLKNDHLLVYKEKKSAIIFHIISQKKLP